jgi:hypothetical protein
VKRIDSEMEESGGQLAPDDHEGVWENLKFRSEWGAELEFSIALLTDMTLDEVREMTLNEAAKRHPTLSRDGALEAEIQIRDVIQRAAENRNYLDKVARMQRDPATLADLFGAEEAEDLDVGGDEDDPCSCSGGVGSKTVGEDQAPRSDRSTADRGCSYCGIGGCHACTHEEMYALDLVAAFCSFAAKEAGDLGLAMGLVRALCDELVLEETEEGWVEWRGDADQKIATIATRAIRDDTYLLSSLSAYLAEPDDPRISVYREAERGALEQVRAGYPDELRPADVTVFG